MRDSTIAARASRSPVPPASAANVAGSLTRFSRGPPPPPRPAPPPRAPAPAARAVVVAGAAGPRPRASSNAYAPPGPARPPGHVGHGAPAVFTAVAVIDGAAPRRALPGIGVLGTTATSAPRSTA